MLASADGIASTGAGGQGRNDLSGMASSIPGPSTATFLRQAQLDPAATGYHVTAANVNQLYRSLWTGMFAAVPPAHFLPREVAPSAMHALVFLERCNWKLGAAQKRAAAEINQRRREALGSLASSTSPSSPGASLSRATSPQLSSSSKGRAFAPPRQATPPPGIDSDEYLGPDYGVDRKGLPCGHIFQKGETIYRCRDCALDDTCVLCAPCFSASNHEGHNIVFNVSDASGGCCDCGDEEAWKQLVHCCYHSADGGQGSTSEAGHAIQQDSPLDHDVAMQDGASEKGKAPERLNVDAEKDAILGVQNLLSHIPHSLRDAFVRQLAGLLAFILDTLEHAPSKTKLEVGPDAVQEIKKQKTLEPSEHNDEMFDYASTPVGAYTFDNTSHQRTYAVLLWNDEKHSFREVIDIVSEATGKSESEAKNVADRVDRHGREIIEISTEVRRLYLLAHKLGQIDLAVTIRPAYDVFAEEIAGHVLAYLLDLSSATLSIAIPGSQSADESPHPLDNLVPSAIVMRAAIADALLMEWHQRSPISHQHMSQEFFDARRLLHLDGLLLMDHKMWKSSRSYLRGLYMALIGPREIKRAFSQRFAAMFAKIVETFILHDREPEHSVRYIAVQIFSVPSIATELVRSQHLFFKMLLMLESIFTGQTSTGALTLPPQPLQKPTASPQSMLVRQQRCQHILQDLKYILAADGVREQITIHPQYLVQFANFLSLFNAILPERRAVVEHVEFESDLWIPVVHITTYLAYLSKLFGEAYQKASSQTLVSMISLLAKTTLAKLHDKDAPHHAPPSFVSVTYGENDYNIVDFDVLTQPVSFYHPMHWLMAEMLKTISRRGFIDGQEYFGDTLLSEFGEDDLLVLNDFPLRVVTKLKQIRAGMWVRNGFGIRSQAHHYRDNNIREVTLDQDLFLLQCNLAMCDQDRVLMTYAERLSFLNPINDDLYDGPDRDPPWDKRNFMIEEFLLLLVTLLSETSMAAEWSMDDLLKREIIHFLALGQGTFSEITRYISDKLKDHASFERILAQVSNYRAPDGSSDLGIFTLRPEYYSEVDPYFMHYTRNQREIAEQAVRTHQKASNPNVDAAASFVIPHKKLSARANPTLERLRKVFLQPVFNLFIFMITREVEFDIKDHSDASDNELAVDNVPEGVIDAFLQLIMMGLIECGSEFAQCLSGGWTDWGCTVSVLQDLHENPKIANAHKRLEWILNEASRLDAESRHVLSRHSDWKREELSNGGALEVSADEKRKAAAKARQAAIMQQFSAQQQSLLNSLDDDISDGDDLDSPTSHSHEEGRAMDADTDAAQETQVRRHVRKIVLGNCIFCQEDLTATDSFGRLTHVQPSRLIRNTPRHDAHSLQQSLQTPLTLDRNDNDGKRIKPDRNGKLEDEQRSNSATRNWDGFPAEEHRFGFYTSSCGHLMHLDCFDTYCRSIEQRHNQQIARNHPEDLSKSEFVCPLCKSLGNLILPIAKAFDNKLSSPLEIDTTPLSDWIRKININILKTDPRNLREDMQELEYGTGCFSHWFAEDACSIFDTRIQNSSQKTTREEMVRMLNKLCNTLKPLSQSTRSNRSVHQNRTILSSPNRKMYIPEEVIGYTIGVLEISQRGKSPAVTRERHTAPSNETSTVADAISETSLDLIVSLLQCLRQLEVLEYGEEDAALRHGMLMRLLPQWGGHDAVRAPLLLRDPLSVLVEAAIIIPESIRQVTVLMFYVQLIQVIFGIAQPSLWPQGGSSAHSRISALRSAFRPGDSDGMGVFGTSDTEAVASSFDDVRGTVSNIIGLVGYARGNITLGVDNLDDASLAKMICTYSLPFLRRACILQKAMEGIMPAGLNKAVPDENVHSSEYLRLMHRLDIPLPREALSANASRPTALASLVEGWIKHAYPQLASIFRPLPIQPSPLATSTKTTTGNGALHHHQHGYHPTLQLEHPHIYELIRLPNTLTSLLTQCQSMKCKRCGEPPPEPAICLECGELLCFQNFCCQGSDGRGECNLHLDQCGHAVGMFFKIKSNIILLLHNTKGSFTYSPYLDLHGEIDIGLKKGKIQYLHDARFDELRKQWLQHSLPNMIARKIEAAMDQGGWIAM